MASTLRIVAYVLAGIPATIGVTFVARYAYVTSDTVIDGAANAFLFGMIATGAFVGPAIVLAVAGRRRPAAAIVLGFLAFIAVLVNWSHTLGAISQRGARGEAQNNRAKATEKDARTELARITAERASMQFTPATADTVSAARAAVAAAERARVAECGNGEPRHRGINCRAREEAEQAARTALTTAEANRAATDQAAKLDERADAIRAKINTTEPPRIQNALGEMLANLLPLTAATAASAQQAFVSGVAELLIAAALALPELLMKSAAPAARKPGQEESVTAEVMKATGMTLPVVNVTPQFAADIDTVGRFMMACLVKAPGEEIAARAIYARYLAWCADELPGVTALAVPDFAERFAARCKRYSITTRKDEDGAIICLGLRLTAPKPPALRLGKTRNRAQWRDIVEQQATIIHPI
jgi:hypothetical protein